MEERVALHLTHPTDTSVVIEHRFAASGGPPRTLEGHTNPVQGVAFSPDSRRLASASADGSVCRWPLNLNELIVRARRLTGRELREQEREHYMIESDL